MSDTTIAVAIPDLSGTRELWEAGIQFYPNPVQDILSLSFDGEKAEAILFDVRGMELLRATLLNGVNRIDVGQWESGWYVLEVKQGTERYRAKFLKL